MKLWISGRKFKVIFQKPKNLGRNGTAAGREFVDTQRIYVDRTNTKGRQREVLLHEVIHVVDFMGHLEFTEAQTHALANGLFAVMRDNPQFVEFVTGVQGPTGAVVPKGEAKC